MASETDWLGIVAEMNAVWDRTGRSLDVADYLRNYIESRYIEKGDAAALYAQTLLLCRLNDRDTEITALTKSLQEARDALTNIITNAVSTIAKIKKKDE